MDLTEEIPSESTTKVSEVEKIPVEEIQPKEEEKEDDINFDEEDEINPSYPEKMKFVSFISHFF